MKSSNPPAAPPPPPPPPPAPKAQAPANNMGTATTALFQEIQSGGVGITSRLRHVSDAEKSYKQQGGQPGHGATDMSGLGRRKTVDAPATAGGNSTASSAAAPVLRLEGDKRWVVQHHVGTPDKQVQLTLDPVRMTHAVRIENCRHVYLTINAKVNSVSIVGCKKVQVALSSVVSSVEILRCDGTDVQVSEAAPTIAVEKSDTVSLYLMHPQHSRQTDIVTSCASSVNIVFPSEKEGDDAVERPIPEQFVSKIVKDQKGGYTIETKPNLINL